MFIIQRETAKPHPVSSGNLPLNYGSLTWSRCLHEIWFLQSSFQYLWNKVSFDSHKIVYMGMETLDRFSAIYLKGDNCCDTQFAFQHTKTLENWVFSKMKEWSHQKHRLAILASVPIPLSVLLWLKAESTKQNGFWIHEQFWLICRKIQMSHCTSFCIGF